MIDRDKFEELLYKSQRCQRNWDLSKKIPKEDVDTMIHAIKSAPSKQNEKHFQVSIISSYDHRFAIYNATHNFTCSSKLTSPQNTELHGLSRL